MDHDEEIYNKPIHEGPRCPLSSFACGRISNFYHKLLRNMKKDEHKDKNKSMGSHCTKIKCIKKDRTERQKSRHIQ